MSLDFLAESIQRLPQLDKITITDHSFAIYFPEALAWSWKYMTDSSIFDSYRDRGNTILDNHLRELHFRKFEGFIPGIEVEMMHDGRLTMDNAFRNRLDVIIGSIHFMPVSGLSSSEILKKWQYHTTELLNKGIDVLGHPFRWIINQNIDVSESIVRTIVGEAINAGVALELNSHYEIKTDSLMLREAIRQGAVIAFSTDAHNQVEVGNFSYHDSLLEKNQILLSDLKIFAKTF